MENHINAYNWAWCVAGHLFFVWQVSSGGHCDYDGGYLEDPLLLSGASRFQKAPNPQKPQAF